jgi:hypothetical protein
MTDDLTPAQDLAQQQAQVAAMSEQLNADAPDGAGQDLQQQQENAQELGERLNEPPTPAPATDNEPPPDPTPNDLTYAPDPDGPDGNDAPTPAVPNEHSDGGADATPAE